MSRNHNPGWRQSDEIDTSYAAANAEARDVALARYREVFAATAGDAAAKHTAALVAIWGCRKMTLEDWEDNDFCFCAIEAEAVAAP